MHDRLRPEANDPRNGDAAENAASEQSWAPVPEPTPPPVEPASPVAEEAPEADVEPAPKPEPGAAALPGPSDYERRRRLAFLRRNESWESEPEPESEQKSEPEPEPEPEPKSERKQKKKSADPHHADKRAKKLVGLKIGASQIAAARVHNNGAPELVEAFREPLDHGVVVSGEIRDTTALAGALERFFERHKLPKKGVRLGLSNNRIGVRVFEIEGVTDERQLENAIRFRAEEVLPIPLDEAVLDYVVLDDEVREGTHVQRILLVVAYKEVVDRYLEACHGAGIEVIGIDLEAFAVLRALRAPSDEATGESAFVAVAVGHDRTTIAVSTGRVCEFTRVLDWGGWALNVAIARALDRAPSEVESVKRQLSFSEVVPVEGLEPEQAAKAHEAVQKALAAFARELVASLHFYQAQPGALGIGEIVLTGGAAHMTGFAEAVGRLIGAPVRLGDPFQRVRVGKNADTDDQAGSFAVAIGLGIED